MKTAIHIFCLLISLATIAQKKEKNLTIQSTPNFLYRDGANVVTIEVQKSYRKALFILTSEEAEIKPSTESKRRFLVIPKGETCVVKISQKKGKKVIEIGKITYNIVQAPKPTIVLLMNGQKMSPEAKAQKGSRITVKIVPDSAYKAKYPSDARYEISHIDVFVDCGDGEKQVGGADLNGRDAAAGLDLPIPGTVYGCEKEAKVYFKIKDIQQKNFRNEIMVDERFTAEEKNLIVKIQK